MSSNKTYAEVAPGVKGVDRDHPAESGYLVEVVDGLNGVVRFTDGRGGPAQPRKKIAICGFAASSRNLAPFDNPEWEIWGLNQLYRHIPRATRWFDIHANWREDNVAGTDHPAWLAQCGIPVYMSSYEPSVPTCVNYPLQRVIDRTTGVDYFTSTVAFMVALAINEIDAQVLTEIASLAKAANYADNGPISAAEREAREILLDPVAYESWKDARYAERTIALFGIDLIVGTEFDFQKACVEFLLGLAQARNITINLPSVCALLKQRWRYGYEAEPSGQLIKLAELQKRQAALQNEKSQLIARLQTIDGAIQEGGYWAQVGELRSRGGEVVLNDQ